jgi:predicted metal-dependent peptidase
MISVYNQMSRRYGSNVLLPARRQKIRENRKSKCGVFVDVSGSVFDKGIQFDFASIIKSIPDEIAEIWIWTFDAGIRSPAMRPWNYAPMEGGGGTQPWDGIAEIMNDPLYSDMDGWMMLTDGQFAAPPAGLITNPGMWCFVLTSEVKGGGTDVAVPSGAKVVHTYMQDPEWVKEQIAKGAPKDPFRNVTVKR